eukprot:scaffold208998_cov15-Tisochrysis_lutea.AAC.1
MDLGLSERLAFRWEFCKHSGMVGMASHLTKWYGGLELILGPGVFKAFDLHKMDVYMLLLPECMLAGSLKVNFKL